MASASEWGRYYRVKEEIMAVLYWVHTQNQIDIFKEGYVGVTSNLAKRIQSHKSKFKDLCNQIIVDTIIIADSAYCYYIENKLRPFKNIGWNKAIGGYKNNAMYGKDNPNFNKCGEQANVFKGWYITPFGKFANAVEAGKILGINQLTVIRKCKGRKVNGRFLPPQNGWSFEKKV